MPRKKTATRKKASARKKAPARKKSVARKTPARKASGAPRRKVPNPYLPEILDTLAKTYPDAHCELNHQTPFQLLIATILSAQCTDVRVNMVTAELFAKYQGPADYLAVLAEELEEDIRTTGFFRSKAKNIRAACAELLDKHGGEVPRTMAELKSLGGVGRKTANVVLGNIWNEPDGVVVDTHVRRISQKLALTNQDDPVKIERDLNAIVPREHWVMFSHWLIWHGRRICKARNPLCDDCSIYAYCPTRA
jgi:endonuclease-3